MTKRLSSWINEAQAKFIMKPTAHGLIERKGRKFDIAEYCYLSFENFKA